jgi:hypothetical protein
MSYLHVTDDERELTAFLCGELGAKLLLSDIAAAGEPRFADDPISALPSGLPAAAVFGSTEVRTLIFWLPAIGPVKTFRDAPPASDARDRVARRLSREVAGEQFLDLIDLERTPVLTFNRSHWHAQNRLAPGNLGSVPTRSAVIPPGVKRAHSRAQRWLRKRGVKIDPFAYCAEVSDRRPRHLGPLWVWVQPHAMALVKQGTEIWPWNA